MRKMNIKAALHYQLAYMLEASLWTFAIVLAIAIFFSILFPVIITTFSDVNDVVYEVAEALTIDVNDENGNTVIISFFNLGAVAFVSLFIVGIAGIREDLRLFLQHGMGRYTTFFSTLWCSLICATVIGAFCELLNIITRHWELFPMQGLNLNTDYGFIAGWLFHTALFFSVWQLGTLISLIYYRLNRIGQVLFSVSLGAIVIFGIPNLFRGWINIEGIEAMISGISDHVNVILFASVSGVLSAIFSFLLIRRAEVKE